MNAIDRRYQSYLGFPAADRTASQDAAAATAAFKVLMKHYPAHKATLEDSYTMTMAEIADGRRKEAGRLIGERAAEAAVGAQGIDPAVPQPHYRPRTRPGEWIHTSIPSLETYWYAFRPWVVGSDRLMPPPPPLLTSKRYARDYEEVRRLGGRDSKERTREQTLIARYCQATTWRRWSATSPTAQGGGRSTMPGSWRPTRWRSTTRCRR